MDGNAALRACGLRVTPQRSAVLWALATRSDHPTAEDLFRSLRHEQPTLALSTVYSTLETFEAVGLARRLSLGEGRDRYDANVQPHAHLVCVGCRRVVDVLLAPLALPEDIDRLGFSYAYSTVIHHGVCRDCQRPAQADTV